MDNTFKPPRPLNTAVLFMVFNRPDTTAQVFEAIRQARPPRLYVAADGPREGRDGEAERVARVRKIATSVDWPCEVKTLFRKKNLGCKYAVSGAITWFFEQEEQGIILEDDCLPSQSFFWFCEELLNRYAENKRIFNIAGYNKQQKWKPEKNDYFFSISGGIWGWATWRRAWELYDLEMSSLKELTETNYFEDLLGKKLGRIRKAQLLKAQSDLISGRINSWDYQWAFTRHKWNALACVPTVSLVSNIGFGDNATHTTERNNEKIEHKEISFPIRLNTNMTPDERYDLLFLRQISMYDRVIRRIFKMFNIR